MAGDSEVDVVDDPDWSTFPELAGALQVIYPSWRDCFCVCVCPGLCVWAVGIASRAKNRQDAARIALAGAIGAQSIVSCNALLAAVRSYPAFMGFLGRVRTTLGSEPP